MPLSLRLAWLILASTAILAAVHTINKLTSEGVKITISLNLDAPNILKKKQQ